MKITVLNVLMFLVIVINQHTYGDGERPTWHESCTFIHHKETSPTYFKIDMSEYGIKTEAECEDRCGRDQTCGMYTFREGSNSKLCHLHPLTPMLLEKLTGLKAESFLIFNDWTNTGYKNCEAILPVMMWVEYDTKGISSDNRIVQLFTFGKPGMTPEHCQAQCTVYSECRSVTYYIFKGHHTTHCELYSITITELLEANRDSEIYTNTDTQSPVFKTYDRVYGSAGGGIASLKRSSQDTQPSFGEEHRSLADAGDKTQNTLDDQPGQDLVASSQLLDNDGAGSNTGESDHQAPAPESPGA